MNEIIFFGYQNQDKHCLRIVCFHFHVRKLTFHDNRKLKKLYRIYAFEQHIYCDNYIFKLRRPKSEKEMKFSTHSIFVSFELFALMRRNIFAVIKKKQILYQPLPFEFHFF